MTGTTALPSRSMTRPTSCLTHPLTLLGMAALLAGCVQSAPPARAPAATPVEPVSRPTLDRTRPPTLGPLRELTLPPVITRELPNGLKLVIVEHHEIPVADFVLLVGTGAEADPTSKAGVATLTASLLQEGAGNRTSLQIADQEAFLGASISTSSGWDASTIRLHTPTAQLDSALALFADVAMQPTFPAAELERLRQNRLTDLLQSRDRPTTIADRAYASILYGSAHPYGQALVGTEASTKAIRHADIRNFFTAYYRPNNATMIIVGDVQADDIERRVARLFGSWERKAVPATTLREPPASRPTTIYLIDKPGAPQSSFRIGSVGVPRSTDDYFALLVMNTALGGTFTSRLMQNLRETKAYTYGAGSSFAMRRAAGPFTARAEIVGTKTDSALIEFMNELRAIRDTMPLAELEKTKRYIQLQLPGNFETTANIAGQLVPLVLYGLPLDYYNSYVRRIDAVTQADVQRVAQRYIDPSKMTVLIVGDRTSVEPMLRSLDFGEVLLRDLSGNPIPK